MMNNKNFSVRGVERKRVNEMNDINRYQVVNLNNTTYQKVKVVEPSPSNATIPNFVVEFEESFCNISFEEGVPDGIFQEMKSELEQEFLLDKVTPQIQEVIRQKIQYRLRLMAYENRIYKFNSKWMYVSRYGQ